MLDEDVVQYKADWRLALILRGFGLGQFQTILYNMIPGAISIVCNILSVTYPLSLSTGAD